MSWDNIKENIKISAKESLGLHELKQHKPWFDEECLHFLGQRKQVKLQWVQDSSQNNVYNLNNVRCEATNHFRNKKKAKIEELGTNSKIKNIRELYRGINDVKKGYQARTNVVKDEKGDLVADSYNIVARWRNYFSQLLNVLGVNGIKPRDIHTTEPCLSHVHLRLSWLLKS